MVNEKFNLSKAIQQLNRNETFDDDDLLSLESLHNVCDTDIFKALGKKGLTDISTSSLIERLDKISNNFSSLSENCFIPNAMCHRFDEIFDKLVTQEGICYVTNMLTHEDLYEEIIIPSLRYPKHGLRSDWNIYGYRNMSIYAYPYRIMGSGETASLKLKLKMKRQDVNYACKGAANGYRLTLHTPGELPRPSLHFYRIPFDTETLISIKPRGMTTSNNLRSYGPKQRQCYFENEKKLKFFKMYTQSNCQLECFAGKNYSKFLLHQKDFSLLNFTKNFFNFSSQFK